MLLTAMLVICPKKGEEITSDAPKCGSMLVTASGQMPEVIATEPGVMRIFSG